MIAPIQSMQSAHLIMLIVMDGRKNMKRLLATLEEIIREGEKKMKLEKAQQRSIEEYVP